MCQTTQNPLMANTTELHIRRLQQILPDVKELSADLYEGVREYIFMQIPFFSTLAVLANEVKKGTHSGFFGDGVAYIPFTVGEADGTRYRTRIMELLHGVFLTANMSEPTMKSVKEILHKHGLDILSLCCCGTMIGEREKIEEIRGSQEHLDFDKISTFFDAIPTDIVLVKSLGNLEDTQLLDTGASGAENALLQEVERVTHLLSKVMAGEGFEISLDDISTNSELSEIAERMERRAQAA